MKRYIGILFPSVMLLMLCLTGCNKDMKPQNLIPEKKYVKLLAEFNLLKAYQEVYKDSAKTVQLRTKILTHYEVNLEQFNSSRDYYIKKKKQHELLKKALDELNVVRDTLWNIDRKPDTTKKIFHTKPKMKIKSDTQSSRKR